MTFPHSRFLRRPSAFPVTAAYSHSHSSSMSVCTILEKRSKAWHSWRRWSSSSPELRLGLGGSRMVGIDPSLRTTLVSSALRYGVRTFEAPTGTGTEPTLDWVGMWRVLRTALDEHAHEHEHSKSLPQVTLTARFGYHDDGTEIPGDVVVSGTGGTVRHNLSGEYVRRRVRGFREALAHTDINMNTTNRNNREKGNERYVPIHVVWMAHNPEAQGRPGAPLSEVRSVVKDRMVECFVALEELVAESSSCSSSDETETTYKEGISSYGVCSNGLSLPESHPLHLDWRDVLEAADMASRTVHGEGGDAAVCSKLSTLQLPANLLETGGLAVLDAVRQYQPELTRTSVDGRNLNVLLSRPLACYPCAGTGTTRHPFHLVDYRIPASIRLDSNPNLPMNTDSTTTTTTTTTTHDLLKQGETRPPYYTEVLHTTLQHFDAEELLALLIQTPEKQRQLTTEERETLDGCRLLQSILHDLDADLDGCRTVGAYEDELAERIVPLLRDTFEELDEDSASKLETFFVAHGAAVRHAVARNTRELLTKGEVGLGLGTNPQTPLDQVPSYRVPPDVSLQRFALQWLYERTQQHHTQGRGQVLPMVSCAESLHLEDAVDALLRPPV